MTLKHITFFKSNEILFWCIPLDARLPSRALESKKIRCKQAFCLGKRFLWICCQMTCHYIGENSVIWPPRFDIYDYNWHLWMRIVFWSNDSKSKEIHWWDYISFCYWWMEQPYHEGIIDDSFWLYIRCNTYHGTYKIEMHFICR